MKTAISIPDRVFEAADALAEQLGLSRSALYARAVSELVERYSEADITARLDEVYSSDESQLDPVLAEMQLASIAEEDW